MTAPLISLDGVLKRFGEVVAADDVSLTVEPGEFLALLGPSGCGKTTLLRLIAGFDRPDAGRIVIDGMDVTDLPPWQRPVNTVFQSYALFPHLSVAANIAFGLKQDRLPKWEIELRIAEMLALVRLEGEARRKPHQLSGGQRQRVALARALAKRPKALLLDEPLSALDRKLREEMRGELAALQKRLGIAFVFVTHDQDEAMSLAGRLAVMREARLEQEGPPREVYERPQSRYVADFLGRANLIHGRVAGREGGRLLIESVSGALRLRAPDDPALADGTEVWLAVRPENIGLDTHGSPNTLRGTVREAVYAGDVSRYVVEIAEGVHLRLSQPNRAGEPGARPAAGAEVAIAWPEEAGAVLTR